MTNKTLISMDDVLGPGDESKAIVPSDSDRIVNPATEAHLEKWDRGLPPDRRCYGIKLLFAGCEGQTFRDGLHRVGVRHVLFSYFHAAKWLKKWSVQQIADEFGRFDYVFLDSGGFSFHKAKADGKKLDVSLREYADDYYAELKRIGHLFAGCAEVDVYELGQDYMEEKRHEMREEGIPIVPVIQGHPLDEYEAMGWWELYPYIAVGSALMNQKHAGYLTKVYSIARKHGILLHGFAATSAKSILRSQFYSVDSTSWLGGGRYGTTMVFENGRIRHYDQDKKDVRKRFKQRFEDNGLIFENIEKDEWLEVNMMNAVAWRQWAEYTRYTATKCYWLSAAEKAEAIELKAKAFNSEGLIDRKGSIERASVRRLSLVEDAGYDDRAHETLHCDTCHISGRCPRYKEGEPCGFDVNIRLEKHADLKRAVQVVLEAEFGRVMTGVLFEKIEGGILDKNLSEEMVKFLTIVERAKSIFDIRGEEELTIHAKGSQGAVAQMLASVFSPAGSGNGSGNSQTQRAATRVEDEGVIDADYEETGR